MFEQLLRGSVFGRAARFLQRNYQLGGLAALFGAVKRGYAHSKLKQRVAAFAAAPSSAEHSAYARMLDWLNRQLHRLGTAFSRAFRVSLLRRAWVAAFHSRPAKNSLALGLLRAVGWQRWFILAFALYLPLDTVLRSSASLATLASLWDEGFLLLCVLALCFQRMNARETMKAKVTPVDGPMLFFLALSGALCLAVSPDMAVAVEGLRAVVWNLLWFFVLSRIARDVSDWLWFAVPLLLVGVLVSLHGAYQFAAGVPIPAQWVSQAEMGVRTRVFSIFGSPNIMGAFLVMTAPLGAWLAYTLKDWRLKAVAWGATLLMCGACLVTFSRGAWLGMAVAILLFALLVDRRLLILMLGAAVVAVFIPQVSDRLTFLFTSDFAERTMTGGRGERWQVGMTLLRNSNEWLGFGLGRFGGAVAMRHQTLENVTYFYLDNYYLKVLVETGYLGLGGFILLLAGTAASGLRNLLRLAKTKEQILAAAVFSGLCGVLAHCFFENIFEVPYMTAYFWGLAALLVTLRAKKQA